MPTVKEFIQRQAAFNAADDALVDQLVVSFTGIVGDDKLMKETIAKLQASAGQVTAEDQALIDQLEAQQAAKSAKSAKFAADLKALDESNPPEAPTTPVEPSTQ